MGFGTYIRDRREELKRDDPSYSLRQVAERIGIHPTYLSLIEREREDGKKPDPQIIMKLAKELEEDPDLLLALGGRIAPDVERAILARPVLMASLNRQLGNASDMTLRTIAEMLKTRQS